MRRIVVALSCLVAMTATRATSAGATVESVSPSAVSLATLERTELRDADPRVVRVLMLADGFVRAGTRYRRLKSARQLARQTLSSRLQRLSCSEFVWSVFSLAGLDMGEHPISSRRLATADTPYPHALRKVTDGTAMPGDVLVYGMPGDGRARRPQTDGDAQVGHVVIVVSARQRIVVGSHGRDSSAEGEALGAGYRRLPQGFREWSHGRVLLATYRLTPAEPAA